MTSNHKAIPTGLIKGKVWSKIMFCVWLAFAVKIVVAMTAELNLAWFTRYEPRKQTVMMSLSSPSLGLALYNTMAFDPRKVLEEPNFCENSSLTIKFRTHVEWNVSNTLKKELCDSAL